MSWKLISKGAEAYIYKGKYLDFQAIMKIRVPKTYRHPKLDLKLRQLRTKREAKLLYASKKAGVLTPFVYLVDTSNMVIIMEYIEGTLLKDYVQIIEKKGNSNLAVNCMQKAGEIMASLHSYGIIHGDYTTSNIIIEKNTKELFVIDFGLGYITKSKDPEDYAVDIRVFSRGLEIYHTKNYEKYMKAFLEGYQQYPRATTIIERFKEISLRGRYVIERRTKRKFTPTTFHT